MTRANTIKRLQQLGFEFDWSVTGKAPESGMWSGTIDPVGAMSIGGECRGCVVTGDTAGEMYFDAIKEAETNARYLQPCTNPECDMHG